MRLIKITGLALVLSAAMGCAEEVAERVPVVRPVRAIQVADETAMLGRTFPGRAQAVQEVELAFRVGGPLISLPVKVGDAVKKGQEVARIDPRDFDVKLKSVQAEVERGQARATKAQADVKRLTDIRKKNPGFVSQLDYDAAIQNRDASKANVNALRASVSAARDQLADTQLKVPFNGVVVDTYVENFEDVRSKQPIVRIVDASRIEFIVSIPENLISLASQVVNTEVTFDALPNVWVPALIKEIGAEASTATRTYPVTLVLDQPAQKRILPGMVGRARAKLEESAERKLFELPTTALFSGDDASQSFVWIVDESSGNVEKRAVKLGKLNERGVEIADGVNVGEWVATAGVHYIREGQTVRLMNGGK